MVNNEPKDQEASPLVDEESPKVSEDFEDYQSSYKRTTWFYRNWKSIAFNCSTTGILVAILLFNHASRLGNLSKPHSLIYTPTSDYLEYHKVQMDTSGLHLNKYMSTHRTPEVDKAWHDMMEYNNVRLTQEEMLAMNQTSVELGDGGYLAMPTVFHELHCLKQIRWGYHRDEYQDRWSQQDLIDLDAHVEHCIDILRQATICRADTSMITYWWTDVSRVPETDFFGYHQCVNWDLLMTWFKERYVNVYETGILNHPKYGQTYPNGHRKVEDDQGRIPETLPFVPFEGPSRLP